MLLGDWHTAEDLTQDALMIPYRRWNVIAPHARIAYARTVISHLGTRLHRSTHHRREVPHDVSPEPPGSLHEEDEEGVSRRLAIAEALKSLPERQRRAVYLRYWARLSTDEIAVRLGVPPGTARSDLARAARRLRQALVYGIRPTWITARWQERPPAVSRLAGAERLLGEKGARDDQGQTA